MPRILWITLQNSFPIYNDLPERYRYFSGWFCLMLMRLPVGLMTVTDLVQLGSDLRNELV